MIRRWLMVCFVFLLSSCAITPKPISIDERYKEAKEDLKKLFSNQDRTQEKINLYQALARGIKYNLDYRIKLTNNALQAGQLKIAMFTMFPAINTSTSVYKRNNTFASFGITSTGQPTDVLNSTPNTIRSSRVGLSWNILDFGLSYVRARQQGDRIYIAQEESRKQLQQLSQDILVAYWSAYSAQELMVHAKQFEILITKASDKLKSAMLDKTIPKENILNFDAALLEGNRKLIQLQYKYDKAMFDLKHLLSLPTDMRITLDKPPLMLTKASDLSKIDFKKVDAITLALRPELRGQEYQRRIATLGIKTAILQALPGITLNEGWNYNSNKFLLNSIWVDRSIDVAWNLLNLASLPTTLETARTQVEYEKLKLMALTLTVLTETRYAYSHYETLRLEYNVAQKQTINANALFKLNKNRKDASLASEEQVILAKLRTLTAKMDEDLLQSDLSTALGELYLSVGSEILPLNIANESVNKAAATLQNNFILQNTWDFNSYVNNTYQKLFGENLPFTVEIFTETDLKNLKFLQKHLNVKNSTQFACIKKGGKSRYILTYGRYASIEQAKASIRKLPERIAELAPTIIKTDDLKWMT